MPHSCPHCGSSPRFGRGGGELCRARHRSRRVRLTYGSSGAMSASAVASRERTAAGPTAIAARLPRDERPRRDSRSQPALITERASRSTGGPDRAAEEEEDGGAMSRVGGRRGLAPGLRQCGSRLVERTPSRRRSTRRGPHAVRITPRAAVRSRSLHRRVRPPSPARTTLPERAAGEAGTGGSSRPYSRPRRLLRLVAGICDGRRRRVDRPDGDGRRDRRASTDAREVIGDASSRLRWPMAHDDMPFGDALRTGDRAGLEPCRTRPVSRQSDRCGDRGSWPRRAACPAHSLVADRPAVPPLRGSRRCPSGRIADEDRRAPQELASTISARVSRQPGVRSSTLGRPASSPGIARGRFVGGRTSATRFAVSRVSRRGAAGRSWSRVRPDGSPPARRPDQGRSRAGIAWNGDTCLRGAERTASPGTRPVSRTSMDRFGRVRPTVCRQTSARRRRRWARCRGHAAGGLPWRPGELVPPDRRMSHAISGPGDALSRATRRARWRGDRRRRPPLAWIARASGFRGGWSGCPHIALAIFVGSRPAPAGRAR